MSGGCYVVPTGWTLVAFAGSQGNPCPVPSMAANLYEGPDTSTACGCNCMLGKAPTCPPAPIDVHYDNNQGSPSCMSTGMPNQMNDMSACNTDMYTGPFPYGYSNLDMRYTPTAMPTGGMCQSGSASQPQNVTYAAQDTVCTPNSEPCTGDQCTPAFGTFKVCIATSGANQSCPGSTFTVPHTVGGPATFTCDAGGCGCNVTAGKCVGTMKLYTDNNCKNNELDIPADDGCHNTNTSTDTYNSYKYTAGPLSSSCAPTGTSAAQNVALAMPQTICCAP